MKIENKTYSKNDIVNKIIDIAKELAEEFEYTYTSEEENNHPINVWKQCTDEIYYRQFADNYKENNEKGGGYICVRTRFGSPRLDVYCPYAKGFASIEFSNWDSSKKDWSLPYFKYSESQVFGTEGIVLLNRLLNIFEIINTK